jgi:hypothetical protein
LFNLEQQKITQQKEQEETEEQQKNGRRVVRLFYVFLLIPISGLISRKHKVIKHQTRCFYKYR